jgi:leucyl-tRNA synthetase
MQEVTAVTPPERGDRYPFAEVEPRWQKRWEEADLFRASDTSARPKFYALDFFPYPSGAGLSVGHCRNYIPTDAACRYMAMKGYNILHPMGWDAFGQPAENEAIKRGRNPREMVAEYAATYRRQMKLIGISYDWSREINSSEPDYYRWTQWFFLFLYKRGLAYRSHAPTNWCPSCKTGLANEEVKLGHCWRCGSAVEKRPMPQWFFKITAYGDRLISGLDTVNWPDGIKHMQREWIGRSEGAEVDFPLAADRSTRIRIFTTRPDTLHGATFMVLAPEHPLVDAITVDGQKTAVEEYRRQAMLSSEIDRMSTERKKTGVFTGAFAVNPMNGEEIPIWIADYVLMGYGTGAIMCVPAHDQRDFEFATQFGLEIRLVYKQPVDEPLAMAAPDGPELINSGEFSGMRCPPGMGVGEWTRTVVIPAYIKKLEADGQGEARVNYRLRDWLISRQRYWGAPIPIIHCASCGEVAVPDDQLPVRLPDVERYQPSGTGESPLATIPEFVNVKCPKCGGEARRETDTMGGFACSSWYFLRFADPHNAAAPFSEEKVRYWLPVDLYVGGAEHAVMHLLYARFWTKAMHDGGLIDFDEPFQTLRNQGMLLNYTPGRRPVGSEANEEADESVTDWIVLRPEEREGFPEEQIIWRWTKMSKSYGNVVTPDEMAQQFGADVLRVYELFVAPFEEAVQWSTQGMNGSARFVNRVWRLFGDGASRWRPDWRERIAAVSGPNHEKVRRKLHQVLRKVGDDLAAFRFNVGLAAMMELVNEAVPYFASAEADGEVVSEVMETLCLMLAPITPHLCDELWSRLGKTGFTYREPWPGFDPAVAADPMLTVIVQVNGKLRDKIEVAAETPDDEVKRLAMASDKVVAALEGREPRKVVVVPRKLVNVVV